MSHKRYGALWSQAMQELMEQVNSEYSLVLGDKSIPPLIGPEGDPIVPDPYKAKPPVNVGFSHYAPIYVKYISIYNKLEECYDQIIHPQKRQAVRKVLIEVIVRIIELRQQLIFFNPRPQHKFIPLDEILVDLKLNPDDSIPRVPRFITDDYEVKNILEKKNLEIEERIQEIRGAVVVDSLDHKVEKRIPMSINDAVAIIKRMERGQQCMRRAVALRQQKNRDEKAAHELNNGTVVNDSEEHVRKKLSSATIIATAFRRHMAMRRFKTMRQQEFEFLQMVAPASRHTAAVTFEKEAEIKKERKIVQARADTELLKELGRIKSEMESTDCIVIKDRLIEERRQWILSFWKANGTLPLDVLDFYVKDEPPPPPEPKKGAQQQKKQQQKQKSGKQPEPPPNVFKTGTTEALQRFVEESKNHALLWRGLDESHNPQQGPDARLIRRDLLPSLVESMRQEADSKIQEELVNLDTIYNPSKKKKKKKGKKGGKKGKKGKPPKKWTVAMSLISDPQTAFVDAIYDGIIKKIQPAKLDDFVGETAYLSTRQKLSGQYIPPPSPGEIRQFLTEQVILPLSSLEIRQRIPNACRTLLLYGPHGTGKSLLARAIATEVGATFIDLSPNVIAGLYPQAKTGASLLVHKAFLSARLHSPAVIYMDDVEQIFTIPKKKKAKALSAPPGEDTDGLMANGNLGGPTSEELEAAKDPNRIMKELLVHLKQIKKSGPLCTNDDRILFIGCTSKPFAQDVSLKQMFAFFEERIWLSFPTSGSRQVLWKHFLEAKGVNPSTGWLSPDLIANSKNGSSLPSKNSFTARRIPQASGSLRGNSQGLDVSMLAHISEGFSGGAIQHAVEAVLTDRRISQLVQRPLTEEEFLGPLSRSEGYCWPEDWIQFQKYDHAANGEENRQLEISKMLMPPPPKKKN